MEMQSDFDRLLFFEHARKTAEATYAKDPLDAENLTRWGGALLELSQFQPVNESKKMISDAISKLEEALEVNPQKHDAIWCLGNAYTSHGFLTPDEDEAKVYFDKATQCFRQAIDADPQNELYQKSFEVTSKAPELHAQIHKQGPNQQSMGPGPSTSTSTKVRMSEETKTLLDRVTWYLLLVGGDRYLMELVEGLSKKNNDLMYDIFGWVILAVGLVAWVGFAKSNVPPPAPPPPR